MKCALKNSFQRKKYSKMFWLLETLKLYWEVKCWIFTNYLDYFQINTNIKGKTDKITIIVEDLNISLTAIDYPNMKIMDLNDKLY